MPRIFNTGILAEARCTVIVDGGFEGAASEAGAAMQVTTVTGDVAKHVDVGLGACRAYHRGRLVNYACHFRAACQRLAICGAAVCVGHAGAVFSTAACGRAKNTATTGAAGQSSA